MVKQVPRRASAEPEEPPILQPGQTFASIGDRVSSIVLKRRPRWPWWVGFALGFVLTLLYLYTIIALVSIGIGILGNDIPVAWGFPIILFVWWIGIGHAGTLISAILLLFHQEWRSSTNRFAEAMTLFAVANAGLMPILHLGRPWYFYWLAPYPNLQGVWPQFRSPLVWDFFAIAAYAIVSLVFWAIALLPDLATLRERATSRLARVVYGALALGWRNSAQHWARFQEAYVVLAALATPLVVSVHSIVALDFAVSIIPGWHSAVFPPYFVAGALFSGIAMVLTITIPLRAFYRFHDFVTGRHLDVMAKVMLASGLVVAFGYLVEYFLAWYSGNTFDIYVALDRMFGPYAPWFWVMIASNVLVPQLLWLRQVRANPLALFGIALVVNVGMWSERYIIVITSVHRDFLPSSWGIFSATIWDWAFFVGSLGFFAALFFLFVRLLPAIPIFEMRHLLVKTEKDEGRA